MSARPPAWRTSVLLVVLIALLAVGGWFGWRALTGPIAKPSTPCDAQTISGTIASSQVSVRVYNGGSKKGLAASIETQLSGKGFLVPAVGNTNDTVTQTTVVGQSADAPEVQLVAAFFPDAIVKADNRTDHSVDVLVGDTFDITKNFNTKAPTKLAIKSAVICASATPADGASGTAATARPTPTD
jgi:hypothetical protein